MLGQSYVRAPITSVSARDAHAREDVIVVEEPLEIRLDYCRDGVRTLKRVAVTMRTPGADVDLVAGFLFTEGIIGSFRDVEAVQHSGPTGGKRRNRNVVTVRLRPGVAFDEGRLERLFYTTSSCGVCGKASLEAVQMTACPALRADGPRLSADRVHALPETLRCVQAVFDRTGGLHAAALFATDGTLLRLREDVGRHNAMDKLIGSCLVERCEGLLGDGVVLVSGRASFELVQKALMAGIPALAAVGAPSSLAVELAEAFDMTLMGFVRNGRFNVYSGAWRVAEASNAANREAGEGAAHSVVC